MGSSSGSSPGFLPRLLSRLRLAGAVASACLAWQSAAGALPAYVRTALDAFHPEMPPGWGYTLTTVRNDRAITERYEPARPPAGQWTLVETAGRAPTEEELVKYARARSAAPGGTQANFAKTDIDPGSLTLVKEDDLKAEYTATFRDAATGADKMLGHLRLRLVVAKQVPHVVLSVLELMEPYSPILGVKMNELRVETTYSPPGPGRPSLPREIKSHFAGRIFFISTGEDLLLTYREPTPPATELSR